MAFYKIWASRVKNASVEDFIGEKGRLFYNDDDNIIRVSDGVTDGGVVIVDPSNLGSGNTGTSNGDVYIDDFPLNGESATLIFSTYNIGKLLDFQILDSNNQIVEVLYTLESDRLTVDSNVNLLNHTLRVVHFK